jgi:hypothetical protein
MAPDIAEILQNQIIVALKSRKVASEPFQRPQIADFDLYMAALEKIAAEAEVRSERWRQEAEAELKRAELLQTNIAALKEDLTEAKTIAERWRHEAKDAAKRANDLVAELYELTCEHVEMIALRAGQSAISGTHRSG